MQLQNVDFKDWVMTIESDDLFIYEQNLPAERRELVNLISLQICDTPQSVAQILQNLCLYAMDLDLTINVPEACYEIKNMVQAEVINSHSVGKQQFIYL